MWLTPNLISDHLLRTNETLEMPAWLILLENIILCSRYITNFIAVTIVNLFPGNYDSMLCRGCKSTTVTMAVVIIIILWYMYSVLYWWNVHHLCNDLVCLCNIVIRRNRWRGIQRIIGEWKPHAFIVILYYNVVFF